MPLAASITLIIEGISFSSALLIIADANILKSPAPSAPDGRNDLRGRKKRLKRKRMLMGRKEEEGELTGKRTMAGYGKAPPVSSDQRSFSAGAPPEAVPGIRGEAPVGASGRFGSPSP